MKCAKCGKTPDELFEYTSSAEDEGITPEEYVMREEVTYNPRTQLFWCTKCYIKLGMPLGQARAIKSDFILPT